MFLSTADTNVITLLACPLSLGADGNPKPLPLLFRIESPRNTDRACGDLTRAIKKTVVLHVKKHGSELPHLFIIKKVEHAGQFMLGVFLDSSLLDISLIILRKEAESLSVVLDGKSLFDDTPENTSQLQNVIAHAQSLIKSWVESIEITDYYVKVSMYSFHKDIHQSPNLPAIQLAIEEYLKNNKIDGHMFKFEQLYLSDDSSVTVKMIFLAKGHEPDEQLEYDEQWDSFCKNLAKKSGLSRIMLPHFYFHK